MPASKDKTKRTDGERLRTLLQETDHWRNRLAADLAKRNGHVTPHSLEQGGQAIVLGILLLRLCEDRGLEPRGQFASIQRERQSGRRLLEVLNRLGCRYKVSLFQLTPSNDDSAEQEPDLLSLPVNSELIRDILDRTCNDANVRGGSLLRPEILGQVYERCLDAWPHGTNGNANVRRRIAGERRSCGVHYTPAHIVRYIVEETIGRLLKDKTPRQIGRTKTRPVLSILDPACGCGAFLLGAYQFLLDWHRDLYVEDGPPKHRCRLIHSLDGRWRLSVGERKRILTDHIYGVDLDSRAAEIARLSLMLKMLEDIPPADASQQLAKQTMFDLAKNVKCGNALIDNGADDAFDWRQEFAEIIEHGGFDAVIGNPPYRRELDYKPMLDEIARTEFGKRFRSPRMDLWYYFVHRGLELLKPNGLLSFIVNSYWTSGTGAEKLIQALRDEAHVEEILCLGKQKVFDGVRGQHMILRVAKTMRRSSTAIKIVEPDAKAENNTIVERRSTANFYHKSSDQLFVNGKVDLLPPADKLLAKIERHDELQQLGIIRQGIAENPASINRKTNQRFGNRWTVGEGVFALTCTQLKQLNLPNAERRLLRPYYDLCDIERYSLADEPSLTLIYSTKHTCPDIDQFPRIREHLARFEPIMQARRETRNGSNQWWHLHWPRDEQLWQSNKIVALQMAARPSFVPALRPAYVSFSANVFVPDPTRTREHLFYVAAILNSRLMWKWYQHYAKRRGVGLEINGNVLSRSPIRRIDFSKPADVAQHDQVVALVQRRMQLNRQVQSEKSNRPTISSQASKIEHGIDRLVYELYALTKAEARTITQSTEMGTPPGVLRNV